MGWRIGGAGRKAKRRTTMVPGRKSNGKCQVSTKSYMKERFNHFVAMLALMPLLAACPAAAQIMWTLHTFSQFNHNTLINGDGANPFDGLVLSGNMLYGTAAGGGTNGNGAIFALNTNGTGYANLHSFTAGTGSYPNVTNKDGAFPEAGLILLGNTLYGVASGGGTNGNGTVFSIDTNGTGFNILHTFTAGMGSYPNLTNSDGVFPNAEILSGGALFGTASYGGTNGSGTVFGINLGTAVYTNLHNFSALDPVTGTNADGAMPIGIVSSGNTLYGEALSGGTNGHGTLFSINTNGMNFRVLHTFAAGGYDSVINNFTNGDGTVPTGLILSGNTLYGTAFGGGTNGNGTIFAVSTGGTGFTNLYSFTAGAGTIPEVTNNDGAAPDAGLILSGNTLYGMAEYGGNSGAGTVFAINTNGTGFANLYNFTGGGDGANPNSVLVASGSSLYGTSTYGAYSGNGTVFNLSLVAAAPRLGLVPSGASVILTWPTNDAGYTLEFATNLVSPTVWSTNSAVPAVVNGNYAVTNAISGKSKFFRLQSPSAPFGIYMGTFAGQTDNGGFATMVLPDGQGVVVVGYDTPQNVGVFGANFLVPPSGAFTDDAIQGGAASGSFTATSVSGNYLDYTNGDIGAFSGSRKPDTGIQQTNAGFYSGTFGGAASGTAYAVLAADGTGFFYTQETPTNTAGGFGTVDAGNNVLATTVPNDVSIAGTLNPTNHVISGSYSLDGTPLGTFSITRTTGP
jgi:uncharacterized repeat protein (TIGR03803 family)